MTAETGGPGRRLTAEQEGEGARMYAAGASERDVAEALGCSASTAHRLRERLADAQPAQPAETGDDGQGEPQEEAELAALTAMRGELADRITGYGQRADVSRKALDALEAERIAILDGGGDAVQLRDRIGTARQDLDDWATAAQLHTEKLAAVDARIAGIEARRDLARVRAELDAAVAGRDAVFARSGDRQRAAVAGVRAAAEEFVSSYQEEAAAGLRVEQLAQAVTGRAMALGEPLPDVPPAVSTAIAVPGDSMAGPPLALLRAAYRAREGNAAAVAVQLGEAFGWLPPSREETEAEAERMRQMRAEWDRQMLQQQQPAPEPWTRPDTASVGLDEHGREVRWYPGYRPPVPPHPLDAYRR